MNWLDFKSFKSWDGREIMERESVDILMVVDDYYDHKVNRHFNESEIELEFNTKWKEKYGVVL